MSMEVIQGRKAMIDIIMTLERARLKASHIVCSLQYSVHMDLMNERTDLKWVIRHDT